MKVLLLFKLNLELTYCRNPDKNYIFIFNIIFLSHFAQREISDNNIRPIAQSYISKYSINFANRIDYSPLRIAEFIDMHDIFTVL